MNQDFNTIDEIKKKLERFSPEVLVSMVQTLHSPATPPAAKVRIYEIVFDRLMGKPEATIRLAEATIRLEDNMGEMEEAEQFVARLAEEIRQEMGDGE